MVIVDRENRYSAGTHKAVSVTVKSPSFGLLIPAGFAKDPGTDNVIEAILTILHPPSAAAAEIS